MCDTFAIKNSGAVWFAKNSDRESEEPQLVEFHPAAHEPAPGRLRCTYIEIEQAAERRAILVSRPQWMWGAEMGVNDAGVAIGNEAVFSKSILKRGETLLGMDLVRLALERAASAEAAVETIISLLEKYGQGGPAGYRDKNMRYDNSFLIADAKDIFVLETAGREWAVKNAGDGWSISNGYSLTDDFDRASPAAGADFKSAHETFLMPRLACSSARRGLTSALRAAAPQEMSLRYLAQSLRAHASGDGFVGGSNRDVCMHFGGLLRPHSTTASMIARLTPGKGPAAAFTGTAQPCISLFKPAAFNAEPSTLSEVALAEQGRAAVERARRDAGWREEIRKSIGEIEPRILDLIEAGEVDRADELCAAWRRAWINEFVETDLPRQPAVSH